MPNSTLSDRFRHYIRQHSLIGADDKVLVAVSGGVDSMAMLSLFVEAGYAVGVAHCNFQLRGEESAEDEVMVRDEAARLGVPFYNMRFNTQDEMDATGESVQMAARRLRYKWFDSLCLENGYNVIAIAHHADDSIETFFINLFRGTGLRGLTGIHASVGRIVRPLLFASRHDILEYAHQHKIRFREDSSNRSTKYLRNKIRLGLIPRIREINPKFTELMSSNVERLTEAQHFINRSIERIRAEVVEMHGDELVIDPAKIDPELGTGYVLYELMKAEGFKGDVIDALCHALDSGHSGRRFYSKERVAWTDRGRIIVTPIAEEDACEVTLDRTTSKSYCGNQVLFFEHISVDDLENYRVPSNVALVNSDKLTFPLHIRRWREGDSFVPFGMPGHKKVSDYLIDEKVSLAQKGRQFVLVNGDAAADIVWLVSRRIDDRYAITSRTENVLRITAEIL